MDNRVQGCDMTGHEIDPAGEENRNVTGWSGVTVKVDHGSNVPDDGGRPMEVRPATTGCKEACRRLFDLCSPVAIVQTDMRGRFVYVNEAFRNLFEYGSAGTIKANVQKLIAKRDWRTILTKMADDCHVKNMELEAVTAKGGKLIAAAAVTHDGDTMTWLLVDITELRRMERELKVKSDALSDSSAALRALLEQRNRDRLDLEGRVIGNVENLVLPYLNNLMRTQLTPHQETLLSAIKANLDAIVSPFLTNMRRLGSKFTPMEIKVANFIKDGMTVKEIAATLSVSESTVNFHRQHIRDKLGLRNEKANLRSHLQSLLE